MLQLVLYHRITMKCGISSKRYGAFTGCQSHSSTYVLSQIRYGPFDLEAHQRHDDQEGKIDSQSISVFWISSRLVITKGPYWKTGWSRGSPAIYNSGQFLDDRGRSKATRTKTNSVPSSAAVIFTPVSFGSPERTSVWKVGFGMVSSPTRTEPLNTRAGSVSVALSHLFGNEETTYDR